MTKPGLKHELGQEIVNHGYYAYTMSEFEIHRQFFFDIFVHFLKQMLLKNIRKRIFFTETFCQKVYILENYRKNYRKNRFQCYVLCKIYSYSKNVCLKFYFG